MKHFNLLRQALLPLLIMLAAVLPAAAQPLNGTYTVYGTSPDYTTLAAAISDLNSKGVSGPVTIKVRPGTHTMTGLTINTITGASATNRITIESENGSHTTTVIRNTNSSTSTSSNFIFRFNGTDYVTIKNLGLYKTASSAGRCVVYQGSATYCYVDGCRLYGSTSRSSSNARARVYANSVGGAHHNKITNCKIERGGYSVYWRGSGSSSSSLSANNEFSNNELIQPGYYGFYLYYCKDAKVMNNEINTSLSSYFYPIYCQYVDGATVISGNSGSLTGKTSTLRPIHMAYCDGTSTNRILVENNTFTGSSSSSIYPTYNYYCNYLTFKGNKINIATTGTSSDVYAYTAYRGGNLIVENNEITGTGRDYIYAYTVYYSPNCQFTGNKFDLSQTQSGRTCYFYNYNCYYSPNSEFLNNEFDYTYSGGYYWYNYWLYQSNDSKFNNNEVNQTKQYNNGYYVYNYGMYYAKDSEFNSNTWSQVGTQNYYFYNYWMYYSDDATMKDNIIDVKQNRTNSTSAGALNYLYYCNDFTFTGNKISSQTHRGYCYGLYVYMNSRSGGTVANNQISAICTSSGYNYGFYCYYLDGVKVYNNTSYTKTSGTCRGPFTFYYSKNTDVYNNTFHSAATGSTDYAGYLYCTSSSYNNNTFFNNSFTKTSSNGYGLYMYTDDYFTMDYNNVYKPGGNNLYYRASGGGSNSIQAWRNSTGQGMNSLSYMPAFMNASTGDLRPDPTAAGCWALNGRGVQIAGNNKDINGNARAVTTIQGVPDLGAHEFTPTVTPPNCTAVPATATAGSTQTFLFGQDTVCTIAWDAGSTVPTTIDMKQYTGTKPPGITAINPTEMFYYVDAGMSAGTYDFDMNLYYKDPAMGSIASESALRLAEKVGTNQWSGYSPAVSSSNTTRNFIQTPDLTQSGKWTGIDVSDNASADIIIDPMPPFCPGTYAVKLRVKNSGNNKINSLKVTWQLNGTTQGTINHNSTIDINGSANGNEAIISLGNVTFGNTPVNIKAWTHGPNNKVDPVPGDDTMTSSMRAALAGDYTIGGTTPDYPAVSDAINDLNTYGICGDVNFNIRPGTYTGQLELGKVNGTGPNAHITFQAENGDNSSVTITASPTNYQAAHIWKLKDAEYVTIKNITVTTSSPSYGRLVFFEGEPKHDSVVGCRLICTSNTTSYHNPIYSYYTKGEDINIINNEMQNGYYGIYYYGNSGSYTQSLNIIGNTLTGNGYMGMYIGYCAKDMKVNYNKISNPTSNGGYGIYWYMYGMPAGAKEFIGNNVTGTWRYYGVYSYYNDGTASNHLKVMNNAIAVHTTSSSNYAVLFSYNKYMDVINNTFYMSSTNSSSYAAYFYHSSSTYRDITVRNNMFIGRGSSKAGYFYRNSSTQTYDYNNFYTENGSTLLYYNGSARNSLAAYRSASGQGEHSLSHEPGLMAGNTDLRPDPANPNSWALNGRAVHISGNTTDIEMNARVDARANGVPDIGAYEFEPTSIPPAAEASPATAAPGTTQVFTFGGNEVARVTWDANLQLTSPITVRQYSGRRGPNIASQAPNNMYFYTDIVPSGPGNTYSFDATVNYMDIWLGTIAQESELKLAHRLPPTPWAVYGGTLSSVNTGNNVLSGTNLTSFRYFTGLENGSIFSAFIHPTGRTVFCFGDTVTLNAVHSSSGGTYTYQWRLNNNNIAGATTSSYKTTQPGDYSVVVTEKKGSNTKIAEATPVTVTAVAPPMALVSSSGPLTYCTGSNLVLSASAGSGLSYQWALNGVDIAGANNFTYSVKGAGSYSVKVKNIGCETESAVTQVTSGPLQVDLGSDTSFCEVKNVPLILDAGFPGAKYTWSTGDTTRTISPKQTGDYYVTVNGGINCIDTDTIQVNIDPLPSANGISYVKAGNNYTFSPSGPKDATSYLWLFSDGSTSTSQVVNKQVNDPSLYIRLVMYNSCGSDTISLGFPLNVTNVSGEAAISLYPNPAREQITLNVSGDIELSEVSVVNSVGQVMYHNTQVKSNEMKLDLNGYTNGHYMLRATTKDGVILSKPFNVMR